MADVHSGGVPDTQDAAERGTLDVRAAAIEHLAEHIAQGVPGTVTHRSGLDKLRGRGFPNAQVTIRGAASWITLEIAVAWPGPVEKIAAHVRDQVRADTSRLSGSQVRRVDVTVHVLTADQFETTERRVR
ncbi:hypothetical protein [Branchiibius sp. NY16-3462-2]|uniref:hypothetical protein n=1 Tax=Branchiibius sp. NY16-3462-2 TaxID=1807500 RepID=UPI000795072D|nr:hypothetical protein [Branchiibius sp. NY16-3462-2]KYH45402.1 hypothetical protein AZH51_16170 [Branchiibius sp. NY16-3462-2]